MSLLQSPLAPQIKDFLHFLGPDAVQALARVASNNRICPLTTNEAIDIVLLHTNDVARLFSYKRITCQSLFMYLHKHRVAVLQSASKPQLMMAILQFWSSHTQKDVKDQPVAKRRASDPSGHRNGVTEIDNSALTCKTSLARRTLSPASRSFSESEPPAANSSHTTYSTKWETGNSHLQIPNSKGFSSEGAHCTIVRSDEFTKTFCEWYYTMVNRLQPECVYQTGDTLRENIFFNNSTVDIFLIGHVTEECHAQGAKENFTLVSDVFKKHRLLFSPNLESGTQAFKSTHGMVKICCCGTLFQADLFIGIFEQEFGLMMCPIDRAWKILYTKMNLKQAASQNVPSLPSCEIFEIAN